MDKALYYYSLVILLCLEILPLTKGLEAPGPFNLFYTVPFYYGARTDERNSRDVLLNDEPSRFFWSYNYNVDYLGNLWVTDKNKDSIFYISKEPLTFNAIYKVTGTEGISGSRDGNIAKASFNDPTSIYAYDANQTKIILESNL